MRQLLSTALVACIVGALAGASFGAVAQAPAEPPVSTTGLNADTVDGLSAVKATSKKAKRKNRLVATDSKGFLPSNIVKAKWGLIAGKPAFLADGLVGWNEVQGIPGALADGQVGWGELAGIPAGFADGVDDVGGPGYVSATQPGSYDIGAFGSVGIFADTPVGTDIELVIIPVGDHSAGAVIELQNEAFSRGPYPYGGQYPALAAGMLRKWYEAYNDWSTPASFRIRTRVYNTGIAPAAFKMALKRVEVGVVTKAPKKRR